MCKNLSASAVESVNHLRTVAGILDFLFFPPQAKNLKKYFSKGLKILALYSEKVSIMSSIAVEELAGKRIAFVGKGKVSIEDFKLRKPENNEVLIETVSTLISPGTETAFLMALPNTPGVFPQYPGYSNAGIVIATGSNVSEFKVGDRVVSQRGHASHVIAPENIVLHIPEKLSFDEAAFFALSSIALQGVRKADIELGESVVVIGQGLIGQLALQLAKLSGGMPVIGVDFYDYRLKLSIENGADHILNPLKVDLEKEVKEATDGKGAHVVIEATGNPQAIPTALKLAAEYGRIVILGSPRGSCEINFYPEVHKKGLQIIGAHASRRPGFESRHGWWTVKDDNLLALKLIEKGLLKVKNLITLKMNFQEAKNAYMKLIEEKDKVLGIILGWKPTK